MTSETQNMEITPRNNPALYGHEAAEARFLDALGSGRLHHAWLITGPRGIGKATLAYRIARHMLAEEAGGDALFGAATPATSLALSPEHPVFRQVTAGSHPDLKVIARGVNEKTKALRAEIVVEDVRLLHGFFGTTSSMGGWRIVIVDSADDLNRNAANALLKMLEEPPAKSLFLLVSHVPGRLLPTIRSRCRTLRLAPLPEHMVTDALMRAHPGMAAPARAGAAALAEGSIGLALDLAASDGAALYKDIRKLFASLPGLDMLDVHRLAASLSGKRGADAFRIFQMVFNRLIETSVKAASMPQSAEAQDAPWATQASLEQWLALWDKAAHLFNRAEAVNLDPAHVALTLFEDIRGNMAG